MDEVPPELDVATVTLTWSRSEDTSCQLAYDCDAVIAEAMLRRALEIVREDADSDMDMIVERIQA